MIDESLCIETLSTQPFAIDEIRDFDYTYIYTFRVYDFGVSLPRDSIKFVCIV